MIVDYHIIQATSALELREKILNWLGLYPEWKLQGGVSLTYTEQGSLRFAQALVIE